MSLLGLGSTVYFTVKATNKSVKALQELPEDATKKDKILCVAKSSVPAIVSTAATAGTIIASGVESEKTIAGLTAITGSTIAGFKKYKDHAKKIIGEDGIKKIENSMRHEDEAPFITMADNAEFSICFIDIDRMHRHVIETNYRTFLEAEIQAKNTLELTGRLSIGDICRYLGYENSPDYWDNIGFELDVLKFNNGYNGAFTMSLVEDIELNIANIEFSANCGKDFDDMNIPLFPYDIRSIADESCIPTAKIMPCDFI